MLTVETKLAQWRGLYSELCDAEQRLRKAKADRPSSADAVHLEQEVRTLQQSCNRALDAVSAALAARHASSASAALASAAHPA